MCVNKNLKETVLNYYAQWKGVDDQEIDGSTISMGAMSDTKQRLPLKGMASIRRNA